MSVACRTGPSGFMPSLAIRTGYPAHTLVSGAKSSAWSRSAPILGVGLSGRAGQPPGHTQIRKADNVVGMEVGEEDTPNVAPANTDLGEPLQRAAAGVEQDVFGRRLGPGYSPRSGWITGPGHPVPSRVTLMSWACRGAEGDRKPRNTAGRMAIRSGDMSFLSARTMRLNGQRRRSPN